MNFLQKVNSKTELKNFVFKKQELTLIFEDSVYKLDLLTKKISHSKGRFSSLFHENLIKLL